MITHKFKEASGKTRGRLLYVTSTKVINGGYDCKEEETFTPVENLGNPTNPAILVTSRDANCLHRPALDIDVPIAWVHRSDGTDHIWVDVKCSERAYNHLLQVLREFRIIDAAYTKPLTTDEAEACYALDRETTIDSKAVTAYMKAMAPLFRGSFDQLLREAAHHYTTPVDSVPGPEMRHPKLLPLHVGAVVVDSTSNHHLYLDTILSWDGYARVLFALKRAKIIERGYFSMGIQRRATLLRPPWAHKGPAKQSVEEFLANR